MLAVVVEVSNGSPDFLGQLQASRLAAQASRANESQMCRVPMQTAGIARHHLDTQRPANRESC